MRLFILLLTILSCPIATISQEAEEPTEPATKSDSIIFICNTLEAKPKPTDFTVIGDTVNFEVYYIDFECDKYLYEFERTEKKVFVVRRVPADSGTCDKAFDILYAFEGKFINVPPGMYQFQLESAYKGSKSVIFREVFTVK